MGNVFDYATDLNAFYSGAPFSGSAGSAALRAIDVSAYGGFIENLHDESTVSVTSLGNDWYEITWTGSGGNANDTIAEQLHLLYEVPDINGNVVDLTTGQYVVHWTIEYDAAEWDGSNDVIVNAALCLSSGSTYASPGDDLEGTVGIGAGPGTGRGLNASWWVGQSTTGTDVVKVESTWLPDSGGVVRGPCHYVAYDSAGNVEAQGTYGYNTQSMTPVGLVSLSVSLGNDNSLTSGATYTERVRLKAVAIPVG